MSENPNPNPNPASTEGDPKPSETPKSGEQPKPSGSFTQADVDRIVQDRLAQQAKNKFGDYEALKTEAGKSKTLEERVAEMESRASRAEQDALRATIAAAHGISTKKGDKGEPSDAELFLTGTDEATLTAQAERLAGRVSEQKKHGNFAPKEGTAPAGGGAGDGKDDLREFAKQLFNNE